MKIVLSVCPVANNMPESIRCEPVPQSNGFSHVPCGKCLIVHRLKPRPMNMQRLPRHWDKQSSIIPLLRR